MGPSKAFSVAPFLFLCVCLSCCFVCLKISSWKVDTLDNIASDSRYLFSHYHTWGAYCCLLFHSFNLFKLGWTVSLKFIFPSVCNPQGCFLEGTSLGICAVTLIPSPPIPEMTVVLLVSLNVSFFDLLVIWFYFVYLSVSYLDACSPVIASFFIVLHPGA